MDMPSRPVAREHLIDRPVLLAALDVAFDRRLTLIAAQAGAGKTTLMRQWAAAHPDRNFVVLDIEASDDDPSYFARRLTSALMMVAPSVEHASIVTDASHEGLTLPLITALANALEGSPETVILIDDVHHFTNVTLVAELGRFIERLPRTVHVVLASRVDPPIALSRYRLNQTLLEFRPAQLAFTENESAELLHKIVGHPLTPQQVHALREKTEGWAAGLQLAGLHLRHAPDAESFISEFTGSDRLVSDYLSEEVMASLPPHRRRVLLELSALDDMSAELVEAATGSTNAQKILEDLEHENMFLVPLDRHRQWFRFHHLFSELLRTRLRAEDPAGELRILTAAADWHLARGRVRAALDYLLRAQARDGAMEAILSNAGEAAARGHADSAVHSRPLPGELLRSAEINEELFAGVRHALGDEFASTSISPARDPANVSLPSRLHRGWGFVAAQVLWRARPDVSVKTATDRIAELRRGPTAPGEFVDALVSGGRAHFLAGNTKEARKWLVRGLKASASEVVGRVSALSALSLVEAWTGNVALADILLHDALKTARDAEMLTHPAIADAYLASVLTALEPDRQTPQFLSGADPPDADNATGRVASEGPVATAPSIRHPVIAALLPPPSLETKYWAVKTPSVDDSKLVSTILFERVAAALTAGDLQNARQIMSTWDDLVQVVTPLSIVQFHIALARLSAADEAPGNALRELTAALKVAETYGLIDVFLEAGPLILQRLSMVSGPQAAFSEVIRARARQQAASTAVLLSDPLTERELEIISYLPTRLTNVEVARRCFVSVNTIKTHLAHIYRKLDATTRDEAILHARELGLL